MRTDSAVKVRIGANAIEEDVMKRSREPNQRPTMSIPAAGRHYFGLGRNASYAAAARGDIPTIRIGGRIFAVVAGIERKLEEAGRNRSTPAEPRSEAV